MQALLAALSRTNNRLAVGVTNGVSTMWCAYLFGGLAIYGFPYHAIKAATLVQWVSQEFLQLVLLSVIMVGQRVQTDLANKLHERMDNHEETIAAIHEAVTGNE